MSKKAERDKRFGVGQFLKDRNVKLKDSINKNDKAGISEAAHS